MRISRRTSVIIHDLVMMAGAWELAWLVRFNFSIPDAAYSQANLNSLPYVLLIQGAIAWYFGLYRGLWRFASIPDLWNIIRAGFLASLAITLVLFILFRLQDFPRSLFVLYPVFVVFLLGAPRLVYRLWKDHTLDLKQLGAGSRVLVIGAGQAGETLARHMLRDHTHIPIGFIDDKRRLRGSRIHGLTVFGGLEVLEETCRETNPDLLVIAIPSADNKQMQRLVAACERTGVRFRTLPGTRDLAWGGSFVSELRDVAIEDLLGRARVELDWQSISRGISGHRVLVTGGGGSIGAELCRQIARLGPARLVVVERSEYNLFSIDRELRETFPALRLTAHLGDVCDSAGMLELMSAERPELVFHAAAYKHVPLLQEHVREAVRNNVLGTQRVACAAARSGVARFVLISSDKAVNPTSVMGLSKRVAEIVCQDLNARSATSFITVRFGNVLDSAGSVVPLFREQIARGGPVTVTHPEVTRYFMTIPEACQLIMQAADLGEGGEIFVLDMGNPVRISYLAEQMITLSGKRPGEDIGIIYTGLRPGEKLFEELFHSEEQALATAHAKIRLARHRSAGSQHVADTLEGLEAAVEALDTVALEGLMHELVPEFGAESGRRSGPARVVALKNEAG